jgi:hypothetical protein
MAQRSDDTAIRYNPFWLDEVRPFAVLKFELNPKNKDLYFWVVDTKSLTRDLESKVGVSEIKEEELTGIDNEEIRKNEILVRVVGVDYNDSGTMRRYVGGALFYESEKKSWELRARLNILRYSQDTSRPDRRFRLSKPENKVGMFDETVGENYWDKPTSDFKPGLLVYHDEAHRSYREYAGMLGTMFLFSEPKIIQNEAIRYPVTHLKSLLDVSFDLLNAKAPKSKIAVINIPK